MEPSPLKFSPGRRQSLRRCRVRICRETCRRSKGYCIFICIERFAREFEVETGEEVGVGAPSFEVEGEGFEGGEAHDDDDDNCYSFFFGRGG